MNRRFTDRNEGFVCVHCGQQVQPSSKSCRNHCPHCFHSLHVDVFPGDRANTCRGIMEPVEIVRHGKKGFQVVHRCQSCGAITRNVLRFEDDIQPDSFDLALTIMNRHP